MECWLLNAAHMKAVPGRKTVLKDAEWIAQLLERGLLRPSFVPSPPIRRLPLLPRYRVQLMGDRSRDAGRLEKMLEDASIKISSVASSVTTVSARAMLAALIAGKVDRRSWHNRPREKCGPRSRPDRGVDGPLRCRSRRLATAMLGRMDRVEAALAALDQAIVDASRPWAHQIELLQKIPGVGLKTAQVTISETGAGMTRFPSAGHLAAGEGVAPAIHESAGAGPRRKARKQVAHLGTGRDLPRGATRPHRFPPRRLMGTDRGRPLNPR
ncbi:transposase [Arthrobacter sp. KNU40]|uniref:transposase n=1 Tax=Arthrobacter sp. KNU40 TaxID=3447965 RepID=UPI003F62AE42